MNLIGVNGSRFLVAEALFLTMAGMAAGVVTVHEAARETVVTGERYRLSFVRESTDMAIEVRAQDGQWHIVGKPGAVTYGCSQRGEIHEARGLRATWTVSANSRAMSCAG